MQVIIFFKKEKKNFMNDSYCMPYTCLLLNIEIKFRIFRVRLNDSVCVVFVSLARLLDRCNSWAIQAVHAFKKLKTELLENGAISGIINTLLHVV